MNQLDIKKSLKEFSLENTFTLEKNNPSLPYWNLLVSTITEDIDDVPILKNNFFCTRFFH